MRKTLVLLGVLAASCGRLAFAQSLDEEQPIDLCFKAGGQAVLGNGQTPTAFVPTVRVEFDTPIPLGQQVKKCHDGTPSGVCKDGGKPYPPAGPLRLDAIVDLDGVTAPTTGFDPASASSLAQQVKDFEGSIGLTWRFSDADVGGSLITVGAHCEIGTGNYLGATVANALYPNPSFGGCGFMLREIVSKSWAKLLYVRDQRVGTPNWGQLSISAEVPLTVTKGVFYVGVLYVKTIGDPLSVPLKRITVGIQIPELVALFGQKPGATAQAPAGAKLELPAPPSNGSPGR
jgi:hypothetical protein